jgi:hypothetical protein
VTRLHQVATATGSAPASSRIQARGRERSSPSPSSSHSNALPTRWALILLAAVVISLVVGVLTFAETISWPTTLLAALGAGGMAVPGLHQVLSR